jgi:hypothetical protein
MSSLMRVNTIGTRVLTGRVETLANHVSGYTYQTMWGVDAPFDGVRLMFANHLTAGSVVIGPVKVSAPDQIGDGNNSAGNWASVTFSGAATGTLTNATDANDPAITFSDWIPLSSADRTDVVGAPPLLCIRGFVPIATTSFPIANTGISMTGWATKSDGRIRSVRRQTGDSTTITAGFTSTTEISSCLFYGFQFRARGRIITVAGFGDSEMAGSNAGGATLYGDGFLHQAVTAMSSFTSPLSVANFGWGAQTTAQFVLRAERIIPLIKPDISVYNIGSPPNEGANNATINNGARQKLARFLAVCSDNNTVPVLVTEFPWSGLDATSDGFRKVYNAGILTFARTVVADISSVVTDGATPERIKASMSSDGVHLNDSGNAAGAVVLKAALASITGV